MNYILRKAIETFGYHNQLSKCQEELFELGVEVSRCIKNQANLESLASEIADVEIMISQLKIIFYLDKPVEDYKKAKLERLQEKIDGGKRYE